MRRSTPMLGLVLLGAAAAARAAGELGQEEVLALLRGGFGEELVIEKIVASGVVFELTVPVMVQLKQAGATDAVLRALLAARKPPAPEPPGAPAPPADDMALIPAGPFIMGLAEGEADFSREHEVYLGAFYVDRHEVTNAEYEKFDPHHSRDPASNCDACPVTGVSWQEATDYARWAGKRLPTEAEWEKAARGPEGYLYGRSRELLPEIARLDGAFALPVGSYPANGYGLHDMLGNVWEWCADYYDKEAYSRSLGANPRGPARGPGRVVRGGAYSNRQPVHLAARTWAPETYRYRSIGFRCARDARGEAR